VDIFFTDEEVSIPTAQAGEAKHFNAAI